VTAKAQTPLLRSFQPMRNHQISTCPVNVYQRTIPRGAFVTSRNYRNKQQVNVRCVVELGGTLEHSWEAFS
jgi:hypothetical protein